MPRIDTPGAKGPERDELTGSKSDLNPANSSRNAQTEMGQIGTALQRSLEDTRTLDTEVLREKYMEYTDEIVFAAQVAKAQFNKSFDGTQPGSGNFGMDTIYPAYFGWQDWDNLGSLSADTVTTWLDSSVPDELSGTGGEPFTVGDNAVHVVLGFGDWNPSSVINGFGLDLNDTPRPRITTDWSFRGTDLQLRWLDTPYVLKESDDVFAEVYSGEAGDAAPYPIGFTFIEEKPYRNLDPSSLSGTTISGNVVVEN